MLHLVTRGKNALSGAAAICLTAAAAAPHAIAETNYLANPNFSAPGPNGSPSSCGYEQNCPSAAANWNEFTYYNAGVTSATVTTELLPSTLKKGTTMMHVTLQGDTGAVYQQFNTGLAPAKTVYACVWLYIPSGDPYAVGVWAGTYPDSISGGAIMQQPGTWQVVNVSATPDPKTGATNEIFIYGGAVDETSDFYLQVASVSTSHQQCKP